MPVGALLAVGAALDGRAPLGPLAPPAEADVTCGLAIPEAGAGAFERGGWAWLARSIRSSKGARSNRRMMELISSEFGVSMNAKPLDSCVSGLRITFTSSKTRFSALSQDLISSLVTHAGRFPRNTVKLI